MAVNIPLDIVMALGAFLLFLWIIKRRPSAPLPPGPKKLPLIGNLLDMPSEHEWLTYAAWANQYGDIASVSVFGQQYIIVSSAQKAIEMLEKKGHIYSDRPVMQMGGELVGWRDTSVLLPYGNRFRSYRKMFSQVIGTYDAMSRFYHVEEFETRRFLKRVLAKPEELSNNIRKTAGTIILRIAYGYKVKEENDPFVAIADTAFEQFSLSASPSVFLVNLVPALRHLPRWFPGAGFKKTAEAWRKTLYDMVEGPYQFVRKQMDLGTAEPSMLYNLLQNESNLSEAEIYDIKWASASLYAPGSDTTVSAIYGFFKAMVLYPDVQAKAQAEIDAVIGNDRLPTIEDRQRLPYVSALAMEALRWHSVTPGGIPRRVMEDDIHDGYLIPKGSLIITNIWKIAHDPNVYKHPMEFNPARFIKTDKHEPEYDPRDISFGFGRRICPGRFLADISVFISCAMTLATYNITPFVEGGKPIMPDLKQSTGLISHPSDFKCNIVPRSSKARNLINADSTAV